MLTSEDLKTVKDLDGAVRFDPIMQTYIIRIPASNLPSSDLNLVVNIDDSQEKLEYDATRNIYYNNFISAQSVEIVEKAQVFVK